MVQVVDASVALKWFFNEEKHAEAFLILENIIKTPPHFAVPELFFFEISHVFNRLVPKPSRDQLNLMELLLIIGINRFSMSKELMTEIQFFQNLGLSGYDASYIALAKILKGTWITFDKKAHALVQHLNFSKLL